MERHIPCHADRVTGLPASAGAKDCPLLRPSYYPCMHPADYAALPLGGGIAFYLCEEHIRILRTNQCFDISPLNGSLSGKRPAGNVPRDTTHAADSAG